MLASELIFIEDAVKMPLMSLPVRCSLIKHALGLILISPTANLALHQERLNSIGPVTDIVAPNLFHHLSIPAARNLFPKARLWGVHGFAEKRPDIPWDAFLSAPGRAHIQRVKVSRGP